MAAALLMGALILCPGVAEAKLGATVRAAAGAASSVSRLSSNDEGHSALSSVPVLLGSSRAAKQGTSGTSSSKGNGDVQSITRPMDFDRRLIVCNAFPSRAPAELTWNDAVAPEGRTIPFNKCQYVEGNLRQYDRLQLALRPDLAAPLPPHSSPISTSRRANGTASPGAAEVMLADEAIEAAHGTFEVEELPASDATLLLVFGKRDGRSSLAKFSSLVFPGLTEGTDAQVAVLDALPANDTDAMMPTFRLKLEDHAGPHEAPKRVERLSFDRVYSMEAGRYDVSVWSDNTKGAAVETSQRQRENVAAQRVASFKEGKHYVLLRTGGYHGFPQSLVVFPDDDESASAHADGVGAKGRFLYMILGVVCVVAVLLLGALGFRTLRAANRGAAPENDA